MGRPEPVVLFAQTILHSQLDEYVDEVLFSEPVVITACEFLEQNASPSTPNISLVGATSPPSFALEVFVHCDGESRFRRLCLPFLYSHSSSNVLEVEAIVTNHLVLRGTYRSLTLVIYGNTAEDLGQFNIELGLDHSLANVVSSEKTAREKYKSISPACRKGRRRNEEDAGLPSTPLRRAADRSGRGSATAMRKGSSRSGSARHQQFRARAKTRVDDLQDMFSGLQYARKEARSTDAVVLEEQLHQMLREWRAELSVPSPASSLQGNNRDPPSGTPRQLQLAKAEEEDDATSKLVEQQPPPPANQALKHEQGGQEDMKPEPNEEPTADPVTVAQQPPSMAQAQGVIATGGGVLPPATAVFHDQMYYVNQELTVEDLLYEDDYKINLPGSNPEILNNLEGICHQEYPQFNFQQELPPNAYLDMNNYGQSAGDVFHHMSDLLTTMSPEPAAFLRPKCALWDCPRPAQGSERWQDYCSMYHAELAVKEEGPPGTMPVIRPRGIDLKDGPLFAALGAKTLGKHVGIPVCEGAATTKSPWNAPELFDLYIFEGESIREWLFFDKPRTAFHSGSRKQRSLPDYNGRGWHESRKQVMKEFGGLKRSYYMDPQPSSSYEWHLYEYEINDCDAFALYRLEFKSSDAKKSAKSKLACNPLNEIQQQMGRLSAESAVENKRTARARAKEVDTNIYSVQNNTVQANVPYAYQAMSQVDHQLTFLNGNVVYGPHLPYGYSTERNDFYWNPNDGA